MLIIQTERYPAEIRNAIIDSLKKDVSELRICSAYITLSGSKIFRDCCDRFFTKYEFESLPKKVITSFDYGLTDPNAIRFWGNLPATEIRVARPDMIIKGSLTPDAAFHPKMYVFCFPNGLGTVLTGSANMTGRGLTINTETVWLQQNVPRSEIDRVWNLALLNTEPVDDLLLTSYETLRGKIPPSPHHIDTGPVSKPVIPASPVLSVFPESISTGVLMPESYDQMWVQVAQLQGGSGNQLELPRGAHRFFGYQFNKYEISNVVHIGQPVLVSGSHTWTDRPLTWHGDNGMERINLPTAAQGGFKYDNSAVLFRRLRGNHFEIDVVAWDSDLARAWLNASKNISKLYRLGYRTDRIVGFI